MREDKFKQIESLFVDYFKKEADSINNDFNDVRCIVDVHYPPNDEPQYGYFSISLGCNLEKADFDKTDFISFGIDADDHDGKFTMTADIAWGYPEAKTVERVFDEAVEVTQDNLAIIQEKLPYLVAKVRELVRDNPKGK